jgi:hypothetical protein
MIKNPIRTIYEPRPFQRAQICEDWLLGTYILMSDNGKASKWKMFVPRLKPVKDIKGLIKTSFPKNTVITFLGERAIPAHLSFAHENSGQISSVLSEIRSTPSQVFPD